MYINDYYKKPPSKAPTINNFMALHTNRMPYYCSRFYKFYFASNQFYLELFLNLSTMSRKLITSVMSTTFCNMNRTQVHQWRNLPILFSMCTILSNENKIYRSIQPISFVFSVLILYLNYVQSQNVFEVVGTLDNRIFL